VQHIFEGEVTMPGTRLSRSYAWMANLPLLMHAKSLLAIRRRLACLLLACLHMVTLAVTTTPLAIAQSDQAPIIDSVTGSGQGTHGDRQVFSAMVSDDQSLMAVNLLYRFDALSDYQKIEMQPIAGTNLYSASIDTAGTGATLIQYFFEAIDESGNRSLSGFAFDPLERELVAAPSAEVAATPPATAVAQAESSEAAASSGGLSTGRKVLYGVLGVLVVGALIAGSSDSSGGDGRIPIDVTVQNPPTGGN